ncbi:uncharacterized protein LOC113768311 isoform X1 [Coffea eugenioides]|uniref:Uncharacterized protein isoform X1 n=1 Tax=Coffea arabica TaxID=13443 RepID=A0A6P6XBK0_COFAR|nr:uncharacterized protein LOC113741728 isoform X1 [Coffea arabica]XP_027168409.1 uncharacterized protein LOC113768311 isoform X1 [Coffea eugenioides]
MQRHFARRLSVSPAELSYSARGYLRSVWNSDNHIVLRCNIAFAETSNLVGGSKLQWRRSSFAVSAASDSSSEARKGRKRVSKDERRSMVESFVHRYRVLNLGKFPTVSEAQREVGGSYYTVRMLVQELQYKSQMPAINTKESEIEAETKRKVELSIIIGDVLRNQIATEEDTIAYTQEIVKTPLRDSESTKGELEISDYLIKVSEAPIRKKTAGESELTETTVPSVAQTSSDIEALKNESPPLRTSWEKQAVHKNDSLPESDEHPKQDSSPSVSEEEISFSKTGTSSARSDKSEALSDGSDSRNEEPECDVIKFKDNQLEQSPEPEKLTRDLSKEQTDDADSPIESFTWKSLKSLADGFLNMWRKL